ncbi:hypothetical protein RF11_06205 [Thelohanellus kitauei]|uniref:DDE-1 domain-containing protein n=1 Tax=Thelohanellus kitauei TaxID=669202 RepID=A0A0C2MH71_THEKT|nr:hypothetical protein RF11_06205 [Thelohanellus kitauei]
METVDNWMENIWPQFRLGYEDKIKINTNETGLFYKTLFNKTLKFKRRIPWEKIPKDLLTILFCASMTGEKTPVVIVMLNSTICFKMCHTMPTKMHTLVSWDFELIK